MKNNKDNFGIIGYSEMPSCSVASETIIEQMIYNIRGCQVMLDRDLASLYDVETKVLNQAVKRNIERFPDDFRFQLTKEECLRSQIVTFKYIPYAFTENGIAMLSSVLRSQTAIQMNICIMRAFTSMRHIWNNNFIFQKITKLEYHQIEIDKCIDDSTLTLLGKRNTNVTAIVYTHKISEQLELDIKKHNEQYPKIELRCFTKSHDRFLIIDDKLYHIGASMKDLGKKWFAFTIMKDISPEEILQKIISPL